MPYDAPWDYYDAYVIQCTIFAERRTRLKGVLQGCEEALTAVKKMETELYEAGLTALSYREEEEAGEGGEGPPKLVPGDPGIIRLEAQLLHLGALSKVAQGVFYMVPVKVARRNFIVR